VFRPPPYVSSHFKKKTASYSPKAFAEVVALSCHSVNNIALPHLLAHSHSHCHCRARSLSLPLTHHLLPHLLTYRYNLTFSTLIGAGCQVLLVSMIVILFSIGGDIYVGRGSLVTTVIFVYAGCAPIAGCVGLSYRVSYSTTLVTRRAALTSLCSRYLVVLTTLCVCVCVCVCVVTARVSGGHVQPSL
jgi:hypothetical protein